jgi:hypothetical protein
LLLVLVCVPQEKEAEVDALFALVVENVRLAPARLVRPVAPPRSDSRLACSCGGVPQDREGAEQGLEGLGLLSGPRLRMAGRDNLLYLGVLEAKRQQLISYGGKEARDVYAKVVQEWQVSHRDRRSLPCMI